MTRNLSAPERPQLPVHVNTISARFDMVQLRVLVKGRCAGEPFLAALDLVAGSAHLRGKIEGALPQIQLQQRTIRQLASGAWGILKETLGLDRTPETVLTIRQATCEGCPSGYYSFGVCRSERGGCGCFLDAKIRLAKERCPEGHWESCNAD